MKTDYVIPYIFSIIFLLVVLLAFTPLSQAVVQSISYPANNDIISQRSRIPLTVTSSLNSSVCYFSYNNVANVTVACNGATLVDLPNMNGVYNITVSDNNASRLSQVVTVNVQHGNDAVLIYLFTIIILILTPIMLFYNLGRLMEFATNFYDVGLSWSLAFAYFIDYFLYNEIIYAPTMQGWMDLFLNIFGWTLIIFPLLSFLICAIIRATQKKKPIGAN